MQRLADIGPNLYGIVYLDCGHNDIHSEGSGWIITRPE